jgi:hypothetical protein
MEGNAAMSVRNFGSLFMVASCAGAALGCYLVSLRVASERAQLEDVETKIVLALSAPAANQFVSGGFELARLTQPQHKVEFNAPVVLASAPAPEPKRPPIGEAETDDAGAPTSVEPRALIHQASLKTGTREVPTEPAALKPLKHAGSKSTEKPVTAAKPAPKKAVDKPGLAAAKPTKAVDKPALGLAKPVTKPVHMAKVDPLAPLPDKHSTKSVSKPTKDAHPGR